MMNAEKFICVNRHFDPATGELSLRYSFDNGLSFEERITFPHFSRSQYESSIPALERIFDLLLLICGVSYYKALAPQLFTCDAFPIDAATAEFIYKFYIDGLAEFSYKNGIDLDSSFRIGSTNSPSPKPVFAPLPRRTAVPIGGGKDSIVTVECLKSAGEPLVLFSLGSADPIEKTIQVSQLPAIKVFRKLDSRLLELNAAGALNGHVPITGILSAIAAASALLYGFDVIAMSNEHSASAPNLKHNGRDINHQYSKSFAFENLFATYLENHVVTGLSYFSFLRPLSEVAIARRFSRHSAYFNAFHSCNTNFRQFGPQAAQWCGNCPKCRFVFLALSPFIEKRELIQIFGRNLYEDPTQIDGFAELCGLKKHKPFECVGEIQESAAIFLQVSGMQEWQDDLVVRAISVELRRAHTVASNDFDALFQPREPHRLPARYLAALNACG